MGRRLNDHLSSHYFDAANHLTSKRARRKIVAYVESYDDILFWRTVLGSFEDHTRYFEVMLPSRISLVKGKKSVLMNLLSRQVGSSMIACVDADYDYLLQGCTPLSRQVVGNPYVFHTYVYAIENYRCYAQSLHEVCVMATLNDHHIFDFVEYLEAFSKAIFPLFVWNIWVYRQGIYGQFTLTDFNRVVETGHFNLQNPYAAIEKLRRKVGRYIQILQRKHPNAKESYIALKNELKALGVTPATTYLYIQGHHLYDSLVVPMLKRVCNELRRERENEIYRNAVHSTQRHNELASYAHCAEEVEGVLRMNMGYTLSAPFQRLCNDIAAFLERDANRSSVDAVS